MVQQIYKVLGTPVFVAAVVVVVLGWLLRYVRDLNTDQRQARKEFMDWIKTLDRSDDLALEVGIRHVFGTYLPAAVLRALLARPFPTQSILDFGDVWSGLHLKDGQVRWKSPWLGEPSRRNWLKRAIGLGYFVAGCSSLLIFFKADWQTPDAALALDAVWGFLLGLVALAALHWTDRLSHYRRHETLVQDVQALLARGEPVPTTDSSVDTSGAQAMHETVTADVPSRAEPIHVA